MNFFPNFLGPQKGVCFGGPDDDNSYDRQNNVYSWKACSDLCAADPTCYKWTHIQRFNRCLKFKHEFVDQFTGIGCVSGEVCAKPANSVLQGQQTIPREPTPSNPGKFQSFFITVIYSNFPSKFRKEIQKF